MRAKISHRVAGGCVCAVLLGSAGCAPKPAPPMTVSDLMEDRVTLDGVLLKCNEDPANARSDADCLTARIVVERLAQEEDSEEQSRRDAQFQARRDRLRAAQDKLRREQEERSRVDPYTMPVVPVVPVDARPPPAAAGQGAATGSRAFGTN